VADSRPRATEPAFVPAPWTSPQSVWSVLVEAPTAEPLTLDEAKLRAGLDWLPGDPRDAMLADWIAAARAQVEQDTGLALLTQTRDVYLSPTCAGSVVPLPSQCQPVQSIDELAPTRRVGVPPFRPGASLWFAASAVVDDGPTFRVVAGWPDAATLRRQAPSLLHAVGLLVAHYATLGRDLARTDETTPVVFGYDAAIAAYRLVWVI